MDSTCSSACLAGTDWELLDTPASLPLFLIRTQAAGTATHFVVDSAYRNP